MAKPAAQLARTLLRAFQGESCPHHCLVPSRPASVSDVGHGCENVVEFANATVRLGEGATDEIGADVQATGAHRTMLLTDGGVAQTRAFSAVADALSRRRVDFCVFDKVRVEPTDVSFRAAIDFARRGRFDCFVAVGGGSTIDTAKAAALYAANPTADLLDFVARPFGAAKVPEKAAAPLIAVPTTAGTGSEMTAVAVFDLEAERVKTAIRCRQIKPQLAVLDPRNMRSMPRNVAIYSGFDVLCHALESYTAKPFTSRSPRPAHPRLRPIYQGSNPISDVWAREALQIMREYFRRSISDDDDMEARAKMMLASSFAGVGFGNAGVHLCHGLSYPISGQVKSFRAAGYPGEHALIPHGLSVVMTACADFEFTAAACPERHMQAAEWLGADTSARSSTADAGLLVAERIRAFMSDFGVPNGLFELGFELADVPPLVDAAVNSLSALQISPREPTRDALHHIYEQSMQAY